MLSSKLYKSFRQLRDVFNRYNFFCHYEHAEPGDLECFHLLMAYMYIIYHSCCNLDEEYIFQLNGLCAREGRESHIFCVTKF